MWHEGKKHPQTSQLSPAKKNVSFTRPTTNNITINITSGSEINNVTINIPNDEDGEEEEEIFYEDFVKAESKKKKKKNEDGEIVFTVDVSDAPPRRSERVRKASQFKRE